MSLSSRRRRYSRQKYHSFSRPKRSHLTKTVRRQKSNRRLGSRFSWKKISWQQVKETLIHLFTTKEGLKKVGLGGIIFLGLVFALFVWYAKDLPTPNKINSRFSAQSTQIFDRNGKLLYEVHGDKNRILADWNEIPQSCKDATIAIEDQDFYKHSGFSIRGITRAFTGVLSGDRSKGGGSTITQQFVKNALLTNERSYTRKIKEVILAIEIEQMYKKDDILKMYLNEIPYGSNAYGIKVAAKTYFDKEAKDLTVEECAVLAAMPQAPTYYSPYGNHKNELLERKDRVLDNMAEMEFIDEDEAKSAKEKVLAFSNNPYGSITAPHFVMYVKEKLVEKYGERTVNEGGLKVYTSLDLTKQQYAEEAVATNVDKNRKAYNASNASLVAIDPKTGQVLAMVGSRDFFSQEIDGNVNVSIMDRQPGSSFKPLAYATLWKSENWGPGSIVYDLKTDFGGGYNPNNYDGKFRGPVTMRQALQNSLNIPAVKTLYLAGLDDVLATAHAMGITTLNDRDRYGLSLVLGSGEVKLLDMTSAYGVFANNGVKQEPSWFVRIEDNKGKVIDEYKEKQGKKVLDQQVAYLINNVLSDDAARADVFGRGGPLTVRGKTVAAKTGTTNDYKDAWTLGYSPSLVAGVWAGNNDNTPMTRAGGSIAAAPIWHDFMTKALADSKSENFSKPSGIKTVTIDSITGNKPGEGSKTISDIFPSWYKIPIGNNSKEVKIDKTTGKLATDKCPADLVETRIYSAIAAEIPTTDSSYARWFAPIAAWAQQAGYSTNLSQIPTEYCDADHSIAIFTVSIQSPANNATVGKVFYIDVSTASSSGIKEVKVTIGGVTATAQANGDNLYTASFDNLPNGDYQVVATATDNSGQTKTASIKITVDKSP